MSHKRLWILFSLVIVLSFATLLYYGAEIYREAPPWPQQVVTENGTVIFLGDDVKNGMNVWQSIGGQQLGSVWGHGAYVAPDWSADWLHREATFMLYEMAKSRYQKELASLSDAEKAGLQEDLKKELRRNTYDPASGAIRISELRARAIAENMRHYSSLFMNGEDTAGLREDYAIPANTIKDPERMKMMNAFFFWSSWACVTERPGQKITYTNNWPPDKLVGNEPTGALILWTGFSVVLLLAGIALLAFYYAVNHGEEIDNEKLPKLDPLLGLQPTPSMKATLKYFWVVCALMVVQVILGAVTAHYGVEGGAFYGFPLAEWLPYSVTRTWHVQLGIFWIATSWLATGLFIAPAVSEYEPKYQAAGVHFLFIALLIIVVGSLAGQWMGVMQKLGFEANFWFGHQGYEYVDLGRFWQSFLLIGLFLWLFLMARAIWPAFKKQRENRHLLSMFMIASAAIAIFYGAGFMWGRHTNLAIAEYWRWWVVHLWVEGFFEVFATVVIAFLFTRMGLINTKVATLSVLFSTIVFLAGGILGTFHHLYFTGTPTAVLALGATFSALEVVPLVLLGFEGYSHFKVSKAAKWLQAYKWPIYFFISVAFWNLLGAGIFGFLINPPIALYYMQGLNTTPVHGHTALFGVYGMLGIGLMLFVLKGMASRHLWKDGVISFAFWTINIGLALMVFISVLPIGFLQTLASVEHGFWYARSAEFMQQPGMDTLRWLRVIGDTIFSIGILALGYYVIGLKLGYSVKETVDLSEGNHPSGSQD
ncbi:MAG: nitric oxide reductase large subunit [Bdellovibrio sp. ArHS]|uniref:nitric-oxide reductase large subunit n=1 Tax=Bdellovibrio sp. ArHS TaxID=1569284 RepID=UPI000583C42F|nr:nitric-oxide reductase large subunit [Bdellovibrio sp. ArHS]KHD88082.1 MAG: nitric oxide reductase large subunit [Bdellovibrio sp. ArHS]